MLTAISANPAPESSAAPQTNTPNKTAATSETAPEGSATSSSSTSSSSTLSTDTVKISNAGQQALQEARETPSQTQHEANLGDPQAKRLLAKQAAEKASAIA